MFGPQTLPALDNIFSPPIEKPVIQEFISPTLNKSRQKGMEGEAKARALTGGELGEKNANTRKRRWVVEVCHQETQDTIVVIPCTAPM